METFGTSLVGAPRVRAAVPLGWFEDGHGPLSWRHGLALCRALATAGQEVTACVVAEERPPAALLEALDALSRRHGVTVETASEPEPRFEGNPYARLAARFHAWARERSFDAIHTVDLYGLPFYCLMERKAGLGFAGTAFGILVVGPSRPLFLERGRLPEFETFGRLFIEDECRRLADRVHPLAEFPLPAADVEPVRKEPHTALRVLVVGEDLNDGDLRFVAKALRLAAPQLPERLSLTVADLAVPPDPTPFAGFPGTVEVRAVSEAGLPRLLCGADLVVLPSGTRDAHWLAILCAAAGLPVVGRGHPELAVLAPGLAPCGAPSDLAARLCNPPAPVVLPPVPSLDLPAPAPVPDETGGLPLVSVCLTHFNRPHLLHQALASLAAQDYPAFEVILVDDGSDAPEALRTLDALEAAPPVHQFRLIRQANRYLGAARNAAVAAAAGTYILFMDDDNLARPEEIATLIRAAQVSGADIVTCFNDTFSEQRGGQPVVETRRLFFGAAAEVGILVNGFGDANALIRTEVFRRLGGFTEDYGVGHEDYEFFARAVLSGATLLTVPRALFWYRVDPGSMIKTTTLALNHTRALRPYLERGGLTADLAALARGAFVGSERTIAKLQEDGRLKQEAVEALQAEAEVRQKDIAALLDAGGEKQRAIEVLSSELTALRSAIAELQTANEHKQQAIEQQQQTIAALYRSWSWRLTGPLRRAVRLARRAARLFRYRRHRLALVPAADVVEEGGLHRSVGNDPQFLLRPAAHGLPSGWVRLTYAGQGIDHPLLPELFVDAGTGFSEAVKLPLPLMREGRVTQILRLPEGVRGLRFDPLSCTGRFRLDSLEAISLGSLPLFALLAWRRPGMALAGLVQGPRALARTMDDMIRAENAVPALTYRDWVACFDRLDDADRAVIRQRMESLDVEFTVVIPVADSGPGEIAAAVDSIRAQIYPHWRLLMVGGSAGIPLPSDPRISAAADATGLAGKEGWLVFVDPAARLAPHALYLMAEQVAAEPAATILYGDEDRLDAAGERTAPWFKPGWSPDLFLAQNYLGPVIALPRARFDARLAAAVPVEDLAYAAVLRLGEGVGGGLSVRRIPFVLSHRVAESDAARRGRERALLAEHLARRSEPARVEPWLDGTANRVIHALPDPAPKVSIIVPTKDKVDLLRLCVTSLRERTVYPGTFEILVIDNRSETEEAHAYFAELERSGVARVLSYDAPFNYSAINNFGVAHASGSVLAFLNNDIEVIGPDWLAEMVAHAERPGIGAVGALLYYPDDTVQHAGVGLGLHGLVGHLHKGLPRGQRGYGNRAALTQNFSCMTAACLVMRRALFEEVGGFEEEHLHVAFNDIDLCLRLRERGYRLVWTPHAVLYHHEGATRGAVERPERQAQFAIEVGYMMEHWKDAAADDPYYNPNLTLDAEDFALAWPPRVIPPWRRPPRSEAANDAGKTAETGQPACRSPSLGV